MEPILSWIIAATVVGGVLSAVLSAVISFSMPSAWIRSMVSYAVGALLGAAFLDLLPEAFQQTENLENLFAAMLASLLCFFLLEKAAIWRHAHEHTGANRPAHVHSHTGLMIVVGDGFHNFVDGVLLASAFLTDISLGITTAAAIIAHEVPQEIGDFMVLLNAGYPRRRALVFNLLSSLMSVAGGLAGYLALDEAREATPYVLVTAAASFIYIAVADLIPELRKNTDGRSCLLQLSLLGAGVGTIALTHAWLHAH